MEYGRIKVCAAWPRKRMNLTIEGGAGKLFRIAQRSVKFSLKDWLEVDNSGCAIGKVDAKDILANALKRFDPVEGMFHEGSLTQGSDGRRASTFLK